MGLDPGTLFAQEPVYIPLRQPQRSAHDDTAIRLYLDGQCFSFASDQLILHKTSNDKTSNDKNSILQRKDLYYT